MDKKIKKQIEVKQQKLQKLRLQLSGARRQPDEPGEAEQLEKEIAVLEREVEKLKAS